DPPALNVDEERSDASNWVGRPIVAITAIAVILIVAGVLIVLSGIRSSTSGVPVSDGQVNETLPEPSKGDAPTDGGQGNSAGGPESISVERLESEAVQVMLRTTSDRQRYEFPPQALIQIR